MNRRHFIGVSTMTLAAAVGTPAVDHADADGELLQAMDDAFDHAMREFMSARGVPGGALAVARDGRLLLARGYGFADRDQRVPVEPDALFRIASIAKPVTGVAVLKLVEQRKLSLDDRVLPLLDQSLVEGATKMDPRWRQITIRQLLQHTGGWDRNKSFDPMFRPERIARETGSAPPATPRNIIRYMLDRELDFDPGQRYAYSNFGYCLLGRVIEKVTGQDYETYVQQKVLAPIGINRMRIGATLDGKQAASEVRYYTKGNERTKNVFAVPAGQVDWPYGGFHLEAMDAHGGWIGSAIDLVRFANAMEPSLWRPLLKKSTLVTMFAPPPPPVSRNEDGSLTNTFYGCGWMVRPVGKNGRINFWHSGSLPGTATLLVRRADGLVWAALFNQRSEDSKLPDGDIDGALARAAASVAKWPKHDLFARWSGARRAAVER